MFLDVKCTEKLPINLPDTNEIRVGFLFLRLAGLRLNLGPERIERERDQRKRRQHDAE